MKKLLSLFIIAIVFTSCNTSVESEKIAGKWLLDDSRFEKGYMAGDQKDYDSKNRVVTTAFTETRYVKDGTSESINFYERLYINEQDQIMRVVQYSRPPND